MRITDLFKIEAPNRFRKNWRVSFLNSHVFQNDASTQTEAINATIAQLQETIRHLYDHYYLFAADGTVFHLYYNVSWTIDRVNPKSPETVAHAIFEGTSLHNAIAAMIDQVADYNERIKHEDTTTELL
jgi:hypothetical protein